MKKIIREREEMGKREYAKTQITPQQQEQTLDSLPVKQEFFVDGIEQKILHRPLNFEDNNHSRENSWKESENASQKELKRYTPIQLSADNFAMSNKTRQRFAQGLQELLKFDQELNAAENESEISAKGGNNINDCYQDDYNDMKTYSVQERESGLMPHYDQ